MKKVYLVIIVMSQLAQSCKKDLTVLDKRSGYPGSNRPLKIAIVSDIHYMDPSLLGPGGAEGAAFQNYLNQDPKLLQYSALVFKKVMADLLNEKPDILLVPGDITKDGEKIGHQAMAGFLMNCKNAESRYMLCQAITTLTTPRQKNILAMMHIL